MLSLLKKHPVQAKYPIQNNNIAVLIPCHNTPQFIMQHCLQSIQQQTHHNLTVIVYRDGGQRMDWINDLDDPRIIFLESNTNNNIGYARNALLDSIPSYCSHFCFVDSDDMIMPRHIEVMNHSIKEHNYTYNMNRYKLYFKEALSRKVSFYMQEILKRPQLLKLHHASKILKNIPGNPLPTLKAYPNKLYPYLLQPSVWSKLYKNIPLLRQHEFLEIQVQEDATWSLTLSDLLAQQDTNQQEEILCCSTDNTFEEAYVNVGLHKKQRKNKYSEKKYPPLIQAKKNKELEKIILANYNSRDKQSHKTTTSKVAKL